jgi:hypothetical protein
MKKLIIACLMLAGSAQIIHADQLLNAIDTVDVKRVKLLLQKHTHLDPEYKSTLLKAAHESSKEAKRKTKWLFRSGYDLLRLALGAGCVGVGTIVLGSAVGIKKLDLFDHDAEKFAVPLGVAGASAGIFGFIQMYRGWMLRSAHRRLRKAREIESAIVQIPVKHSHNHQEHDHEAYAYATH